MAFNNHAKLCLVLVPLHWLPKGMPMLFWKIIFSNILLWLPSLAFRLFFAYHSMKLFYLSVVACEGRESSILFSTNMELS